MFCYVIVDMFKMEKLELETHKRFSERLKEKGVINEETEIEMIHDRINRDGYFVGRDQRQADYFHDIEAIRSWINSWAHLANQDTKTDYVRLALGHFVLENIESRKEYSDEKNLFWRSLISFKLRGFHRTFFKERQFLTEQE